NGRASANRRGGYPARVRRVVGVVVAALAAAPAANAASLSVSPQLFSPGHARLTVRVQLTVPRQVGVSLVTEAGKRVGWIGPPARPPPLEAGWDGRIGGNRVPDGRYVVRLVYRSAVLATASLEIDSHPARLLDLHVDDASIPFKGDRALLTTVSPNGDKFRDSANVHFRLAETATVTMDVTRTVKVPHPIYTLTARLQPGDHMMTWSPAPTLNPRTYLIQLTTVDRAGNKIVYGAPNAFVGRYPPGPVVRIQGIDAGLDQPSYAPGQHARIHIATDDTSLTMHVVHLGPEQVVTYAHNQLNGVDSGIPPVTMDWTKWRSEPH